MVMITRSAYRRAKESLNSSDISKKNIIKMPPWCSSAKQKPVPKEIKLGKVYERRKPRKAIPPWEAESSYPLRENIWDYLNDRSGRFDNTRRVYVKKNKQKSRVKCTRRVMKLLVCLLAVLGLSVPFWIPDRIPKIDLLKTVLPEVGLLSLVNWHSTSVSEECCYKLKHLTWALSRIEQELRNMLRLRRKFMLSLPNTRTITESTSNKKFPNKDVIHGTKAIKGGSTEEWGTQVALWGVVPLWRTAPPPDTILALRKPKPSDCWPFGGSYGEVIIELPRKMPVNSLSLEHIRPDTARSAPRNFEVYAIEENGTYVKAADGTYSYKKPAKQYYSLNTENAFTKSIVFRVLSNQGNPKYTCIYRVQVYENAENTLML